jgi:hypothetical protein
MAVEKRTSGLNGLTAMLSTVGYGSIPSWDTMAHFGAVV